MSTNARPRRVTRAPAKLPADLSFTATSNATGETKASSMKGERGRKKGKDKCDPSSEDDDGTRDAGRAMRMVEETGASSRTRKGTGKPKAKKSNSAEDKLYDIDFILTNQKSPLVNMDISDVLNYDAWTALSRESRMTLGKLLPPSAFGEEIQELDQWHPSRRNYRGSGLQCVDSKNKTDDRMQVDDPPPSREKTDECSSLREQLLNPSFFKDPYFESAAHTFQDHLHSGWQTRAHRELVEKHLAGVREGSLHAPWKDDVWDREHPEENDQISEEDDASSDPLNSLGVRSERAKGKGSRTSDFEPLVRAGFLKQGDIISFRHRFTALGITVDKDALISAIHPKTFSLTLTASAGSTRDLPPALLVPRPSTRPDYLSSLREMIISTPAQLITALLDLDGRLQRTQRPRLDTWKVLTAWQWSTEASTQDMSTEEAALLERGGRECLGTLFYLRGQALDD